MLLKIQNTGSTEHTNCAARGTLVVAEREQLRVECFIPTKMYYRPACWNAKEELTIFVFLVDTSQTEVVKSKSISDFEDLSICLLGASVAIIAILAVSCISWV